MGAGLEDLTGLGSEVSTQKSSQSHGTKAEAGMNLAWSEMTEHENRGLANRAVGWIKSCKKSVISGDHCETFHMI